MNFHRLVLIGFIIIFIDISVGTIDIVHDSIGYFMLFLAFSKVEHRYTTLGKITSIILLLSSIYFIFMPLNNTANMFLASYTWSAQIILFGIAAVNILNIISIFSVSNTVIQSYTSNFAKIFISYLLLNEVLYSFFIINPVLQPTLFAITTIVGVILHIYFIIFIWRRKNIEPIITSNNHSPPVVDPINF